MNHVVLIFIWLSVCVRANVCVNIRSSRSVVPHRISLFPHLSLPCSPPPSPSTSLFISCGMPHSPTIHTHPIILSVFCWRCPWLRLLPPSPSDPTSRSPCKSLPFPHMCLSTSIICFYQAGSSIPVLPRLHFYQSCVPSSSCFPVRVCVCVLH